MGQGTKTLDYLDEPRKANKHNYFHHSIDNVVY